MNKFLVTLFIILTFIAVVSAKVLLLAGDSYESIVDNKELKDVLPKTISPFPTGGAIDPNCPPLSIQFGNICFIGEDEMTIEYEEKQ